MHRNRLMSPTVAALTLAACTTAALADVEVIYSRAPSSPTSIVPGALDDTGQPITGRFLQMLDFWLSPDGSKWLLRGAIDPTSTDFSSYLLLGSGSAGSLTLQEGQPFPGAVDSEVIEFVGNSVGHPFNSNNEWAYNVRARGGSNTVFNKILRFDAAGIGTLRFQGGNAPGSGSLYTGLTDRTDLGNVSGDETVGNSTASIHLLNDGRIGWHDTTVLNIHTSRRPVTAYDAVKYRQVFVDSVTTLDGSGTVPISGIASFGTISVFLTSPDGTVAVLRGSIDVDGNGTSTNDPNVVIVNDQVRIQVGQVIPGSSVTPTAINQTSVAGNNDWYARGTDANGAWATRNATVIAQTGDSIGADTWGSTFFTIAGNSSGDRIIAGKSSNTDPAIDDVVVVNGSVVLREGDVVPIDLDGDGTLETAFVGRSNNTLAAFAANNSVGLTPDGTIYVIAMLKDASGNDLAPSATPYALLRITPGAVPCPADFNNDGNVDPDDLSDFVTCFFLDIQFPGTCPAADFNNDGFRDPDDLSDFITTFFTAAC